MYTQCPQCKTYFQVTAEHLKIAQGNVRCGQCRNVFSALNNLSEKLPDMSDDNSGLSDTLTRKQFEEDFLTDEELGEFEDFDTNIYDDEDDIFGIEDDEDFEDIAAIEKDSTKEPPQPVKPDKPTPRPYESGLSKAIEKMNELNKSSEGKIQNLTEATTSIIEKLKQHEAAIVEKLKSQEGTSPEPRPGARQPDSAPANKATKTNNTNKKRAGQPATPAGEPSDKASQFQRKAVKTQDIPVQRSQGNVDFDAAFQALDELEINEETADFVDSVVEEFKETQLISPPPRQPEAKPANENKPVAKDNKGNKKAKQKVEKKAKPKTKAKAQNKKPAPKKTKPKRTRKAKTPIDQIDPDLIPTLPGILQEQYQQEAVRQPMSRMSILWGVGSFLMMLAFLFQTVYFKHDQLAKVSQLRPWIELFCDKMNCDVALQFNPKQLELLGQDIRTHPKVKGALKITTTIINNANYIQAYPGLQITFSDINGQKIAMRRFLPAEYLPDANTIEKGMAPDTPVQIVLDVMDPGSKAINFEFDFFNTTL